MSSISIHAGHYFPMQGGAIKTGRNIEPQPIPPWLAEVAIIELQKQGKTVSAHDIALGGGFTPYGLLELIQHAMNRVNSARRIANVQIVPDYMVPE